MKGLAIVLGKPKEEDDEEDGPASEPADESTQREYAKLALEAARDGDVDSFARALRGFVRNCSHESED